jgi:hypothetical protein
MLAFLSGDDTKVSLSRKRCIGELIFQASEELSWALEYCPAEPARNIEYVQRSPTLLIATLTTRLILTYLIPLRLLVGQFPNPNLLTMFPRLNETYSPFIEAIHSGNVRAYDERLEWAQPRLVGMSTYLTLERAREGCLRILFRKA